ncbi:hypothetical protein [Methylocella sp.]|uniref:hypothetical protein n=1 Tax=Methylocella sp. TaxID=1978226 RepID=UPI0035B2CE6B
MSNVQADNDQNPFVAIGNIFVTGFAPIAIGVYLYGMNGQLTTANLTIIFVLYCIFIYTYSIIYINKRIDNIHVFIETKLNSSKDSIIYSIKTRVIISIITIIAIISLFIFVLYINVTGHVHASGIGILKIFCNCMEEFAY